jgi:multimeric flavodoxin WrbA
MNDFMKDPNMERMINDIIEIFTKIEGVELVRLSGMTNHCRQLTGFYSLKEQDIDTILHKLKNAGIINWKFITRCPHCGEISYQIKDIPKTSVKLCDTCNTLYSLTPGDSLLEDSGYSK